MSGICGGISLCAGSRAFGSSRAPKPRHIEKLAEKKTEFFLSQFFKEAPYNSAKADFEKNQVLMMAIFRSSTLCSARKSDEIRA